jgi:hypothetical protein
LGELARQRLRGRARFQKSTNTAMQCLCKTEVALLCFLHKSMPFVKNSQSTSQKGKTAVQGAENAGWMQVSGVERGNL